MTGDVFTRRMKVARYTWRSSQAGKQLRSVPFAPKRGIGLRITEAADIGHVGLKINAARLFEMLRTDGRDILEKIVQEEEFEALRKVELAPIASSS